MSANANANANANVNVKEAARFAATLRAGDFERAGALPNDVLDALGKHGFLGAPLPTAYGGLGLDAITYGEITFAIGKACPATRSVLTVSTSLVGETLARWGSPEQQARWLRPIAKGELIAAFALTEAEHGSDAGGVETSYRKTAGGYVISGSKRWITMGTRADVFLVIAKGDGGIAAYMVERSARVRTTAMTGLLAARASGVAEVVFDDAEVSELGLLGNEGSGLFPIAATALWAGRYSVAWGSVAIAQAALECMTAYADKRRQFDQRLSDFALIRQMIAEATVKVHAGRALCLEAGRAKDAGAPNAPLETTIAKYYTARAAMEVATDAVQLHGANGFCDAYPVERLFREAKLLEIIEGTTQIHQKPIADFALHSYRGTSGGRNR